MSIHSRTKIRRLPELANYDQDALHQLLDEAYICHVAFVVDGQAHCIPTALWREGEYLYIHGSNGSRLIKVLCSGQEASVAITLLDGLVLAKSAFNHSMRYRSAVIYGSFEKVHGRNLKLEAMDVFMNKIARGRSAEARRGNSKEIDATSVLRLQLKEFAVKISDRGPSDTEEDLNLPVWAGVLPFKMARDTPVHAPYNHGVATPDYVASWET